MLLLLFFPLFLCLLLFIFWVFLFAFVEAMVRSADTLNLLLMQTVIVVLLVVGLVAVVVEKWQ